MDGGEPSRTGSSKDKEKRKTNDSFERSKRQRRELRSTSYIDLNETSKRIYLDTKGHIPYQMPTRREPTDNERKSEKYCIFHELDGHNMNDYRHLQDLIE